MMESKSRAAQEKLAELEKTSAPFSAQIQEAAKFVSHELDNVTDTLKTQDYGEIVSSGKYAAATTHGKEEWLLRWLLKKLQSPKDKTPRITQASWQLLRFLLNAIPLPNAARILSDRKFMAILQQTLQDAQQDEDLHKAREAMGNGLSGASSESLEAVKPSKKRTRSGDLIVNKDYKPAYGLAGLVAAIYAAIQRLVHYTRNSPSRKGDVDGRSDAYKSEYIRSIVQTTPEASATILGTWMSLCQKALDQQSDLSAQPSNLLEPFIDIWNYRLVGNEDLMQFSLHCSDHVFALLKQVQTRNSTRDWRVCLEQLVARNIILPAKSDAAEKLDSTLLENLTKVSILQDVTNAALLFDIAIRSLQPRGGHRRRTSDEAWLQRVFTSFCTSMSQNKSGAHSQAICAILRSSREHNIDLGLPELRKITAEYIIPEGSTDWTLLEEVIQLDANVFLIPGENKNLLHEVLGRITNVYFDTNWPGMSFQIISGVTVPLMNEFAKARDLSGFVRHWYEQLVKFEALRDENMISPMDSFCVWEDEALQQELCKLLEPSLTLQQILQILDWLAVEILEHPNAACVILEAVSGSIRMENVVDAVGTRLIHMISDDKIDHKLGDRYSWRIWRILSNSIRWMQSSHQDEIADLWDKRTRSFESTTDTKASSDRVEGPGHSDRLNSLEFLRNACATWDFANTNKLNALARPVVLRSFERLAYDITVLPQALVDDQSNTEWPLKPNTLSRDFGWYTWARLKWVLDEFPRALELCIQHDKESFVNILKHILWIASSTAINSDKFKSLWFGMLQSGQVLRTGLAIGRIIDVSLTCLTQEANPLLKSSVCNGVAIQTLIQLPLETFTKNQRECVIQSWPADVMINSPEWHPAVLALKIKMMQYNTFYKGMNFKDSEELEKVIKKIGYENMPSRRENLTFLRQLVKLTLSHIATNLEQTQNRTYMQDGITYVREKLRKFTDDEKKTKAEKILPFASISQAFFETLKAKSDQLHDLGILGRDDAAELLVSLTEFLISQLQQRLQKKLKMDDVGTPKDGSLPILVILEALESIGVQSSQVVPLVTDIEGYMEKLGGRDPEVTVIRRNLQNFLANHVASDNLDIRDGAWDVSTHTGRLDVQKRIEFMTSKMDKSERLNLLQHLFGEDQAGSTQLNKLLAIKHVIASCQILFSLSIFSASKL
ncbi:hypothetical protein ACMFMG_006449 [Clarireedia jacksonii]